MTIVTSGNSSSTHPTVDGPFVDLHMHSTASDGSVAPAAVVDAAAAVGLSAIALTDHDTLDGLDAAMQRGAELNVRVIAGCELSAHQGTTEIHLLALHIADRAAMQHRLTEFRQQRIERAKRMVEKLNAARIPLSFDDVLREANGGAVGRPHVARALVARGYVVDLRMAFDKYLATGRTAYVPKPRLDAADAIAIAHDAGALAIWAHPARDGVRAAVAALVADGLDGIEVRHPSHSPDDVQRLSAMADDLGLVRSGGSDWHGATEGYRTLGNMHIPMAWLEAQEARLATSRAGRA
jgi:predicted metal-dependent phosphoesterase TrpH